MEKDVGGVFRDSRSASTSLLQKLKTHDEAAWQRVLDLYVPLVFSWCRRSGIPSQDSADVVQEVFRAVLRGIAEFRYSQPADTFRGWLRIITRNKIRDHFRKRHSGRSPRVELMLTNAFWRSLKSNPRTLRTLYPLWA